jgi:anaerobic selenocysteine-containing dehydrogenase
MERDGKEVQFTYEANPGEVWEENEWWIQLSARMDRDGSLGIRQWFESPYRPGEIISIDEYYRWIFENTVPGLPEAAAAEELTPLQFMRKYGAFEVTADNYTPYEKAIPGLSEDEEKKLDSILFRLGEVARGIAREALDLDAEGLVIDFENRILRDGQVVGVMVDQEPKVGFNTPSRKLEFFSPTLRDWGWPEKEYVIPWPLKSHVHPDEIDRSEGEMLLLPNFRLPTLIHTRSANAKWLYEISHKNPIWMHPSDAERLGLQTGELVKVETEIGYFIDKVWVTEGIKPGVIAMSHHLGRWRLQEYGGINPGMSGLAQLDEKPDGAYQLNIIHGGRPWDSFDPDTSRIWWEDVGVHQNLTHAVHPDPISGAHCWLQKAVNVTKAGPSDRHGDVWVDTNRSMEVYRQWLDMTRSAVDVSPDGTRRPSWLKRPLKPTAEAYKLPEEPFGR